MISTLLIGLGDIGLGYDLKASSPDIVFTHAKALSLHQNFELVAAVDSNIASRSLFKNIYCKPAYDSLQTASSEIQTIDLVIVATPTDTHLDIISDLLKKFQPKAILCEKPLAYSFEAAQDINNLCISHNVALYINYIRRCDPGALRIKELIDTKIFALPVKGVAWYSKGYMHNGSHFFNLLEFWLGRFKSARIINSGRKIENTDLEPDLHVVFEGGQITFLAAWEEQFSHYSIEMLSPSGRVSYTRGGEEITWQQLQANPLVLGYSQLATTVIKIPNDMNRYQLNSLDQLYQAMSDNASSICTGNEGLETIRSMQEAVKYL